MRHILSFTITIIIYTTLAFLYIKFISSTKHIEPKKFQRVKISILKPIEPTTKPTVKPKPIIKTPPPIPIIKPKKIRPKIKRKKRVVKRKRVKKRYKKVVKRVKLVKSTPTPTTKPTTKPIIKSTPTPMVYEPIIEEYTPPPKIITTPKPKIDRVVHKRVVSTPKPKLNSEPTLKSNSLKREFLKKIRANIYENKHYPAKAKRRRLEGKVHVIFDILPNGEAINIRTSRAPSTLQRAVKNSIKRSFPIEIPPKLNGLFPMRNISINVEFKLK